MMSVSSFPSLAAPLLKERVEKLSRQFAAATEILSQIDDDMRSEIAQGAKAVYAPDFKILYDIMCGPWLSYVVAVSASQRRHRNIPPPVLVLPGSARELFEIAASWGPDPPRDISRFLRAFDGPSLVSLWDSYCALGRDVDAFVDYACETIAPFCEPATLTFLPHVCSGLADVQTNLIHSYRVCLGCEKSETGSEVTETASNSLLNVATLATICEFLPPDITVLFVTTREIAQVLLERLLSSLGHNPIKGRSHGYFTFRIALEASARQMGTMAENVAGALHLSGACSQQAARLLRARKAQRVVELAEELGKDVHALDQSLMGLFDATGRELSLAEAVRRALVAYREIRE